jgi:hypothetical protein
MRDDVSPQVGRRRISVKEENRISLAFIDVVEPGAADFYEAGLKREFR